MLIQEKIRIMEILDDAGCLDKELKFGCKIKTNIGYNTIVRVDERYFKCYGQKGLSSYHIERFIKSKILGQYGLHSLIQYLFKKGFWVDCDNSLGTGLILKNMEEEIELDLTKPPMEYTQEQDIELLNFLDTIK